MKVVLLQDVRGIGRRNELKEVADGYARNFLFPKKLAVLANVKNLAEKEKNDEQLAAELKQLQNIADKIGKDSFIFTVKAGVKGEVFGSVTKHDIELALKEKGYSNFQPLLDHPIKSLGKHQVEIDLHRGVHAKMNIEIKA
jgi:large subunit ribosomal protein L9